MNRKALASIGTGSHRLLLRLSERSFRSFGARHGYDVHVHTSLVDPGHPPPWSKIPILQELLGRYDEVLWARQRRRDRGPARGSARPST